MYCRHCFYSVLTDVDCIRAHSLSQHTLLHSESTLCWRCCLQGLGEIYEADYLHKVAGTAPEDKLEVTHKRLRAQLSTLFGKLDALSHFHYTPRPIEAMAVQAVQEVPALALEEVNPMVSHPRLVLTQHPAVLEIEQNIGLSLAL